jgi:methionyl-tRNA formyltransferase
VATGEGALELLQLQWPGKRIMTAAEVLSGRPLDGRRFL